MKDPVKKLGQAARRILEQMQNHEYAFLSATQARSYRDSVGELQDNHLIASDTYEGIDGYRLRPKFRKS